MAPLNRSLAARSHTDSQFNLSQKAQDPPPSTLAANLVINLSNSRKPVKTDEQEEFQRLLSDISQANAALEDLQGQERLIHHHKLIYVLAKAVLAPLIKDKPCSYGQSLSDQQVQQAIEALDVITSMIRETPDVLAYIPIPSAQVQSGFRVPLWIWLFSKVLALLGRPDCEGVQEKVRELLTTSFIFTFSDSAACELPSSFFCYFRHCIQGFLDFLPDPNASISNPDLPLDLVFPPSTIEEELSIPNNPDLDIEDCTYTLNSYRFVLSHVSMLLVIMMQTITSPPTLMDKMPASQPFLTWIIESIRTIHSITTTHSHDKTNGDNLSTTQALNVDVVISLLSNCDKDMLPSLKRKCLHLLIVLLFSVLQTSHHALGPSDSVAQLLCRALETCFDKSQDALVQEVLQEHELHEFLIALTDRLLSHLEYVELVTVTFKILSEIDDLRVRLAATKLHDQASFLDINEYKHASKKRKVNAGIDVGAADSPLELYCRHSLAFIPGMDKHDPAIGKGGITNSIVSYYTTMANESAQCLILKRMQSFICDWHGVEDINSYDMDNTAYEIRGTLYSNDRIHTDSTLCEEIVDVLKALIKTPKFEASRNPCVQGMLLLKLLLEHLNDVSIQDLEESALAHWCIKSLKGSMRQLRIAAGRTLPSFMSAESHIAPDVLSRNKINIYQLLKEISEGCPDHQKETCIMAWGQLGRVVDEQDAGIVLLQLVDYLNSTNQILSSVAHNELVLLASYLNSSVFNMLSPYWRRIGPTLVKNLQTRPQAAQLLSDAMGMSVSKMLVAIQAHTLPELVQEKRKDLITKIAQARGDEDVDDPWRLCFENSNIASILAFLLVTNISQENVKTQLERTILGLFLNISSHFNGLDLNDLLRIYPIGIAVEILKLAGDADGSAKARARQALQFLGARDLSPKSDSNHPQPKKPPINNIGIFIERWALGIIAQFSDTLIDARSLQSDAEKIRSLRGIEELLRVGRNHVQTAIPQISACLQSALAHPPTRAVAFSVWTTMVRSIDDEDAGLLLETSFTIIITRWSQFTDVSREAAKAFLHYLLDRRRSLLEEWAYTLPSLSQVPIEHGFHLQDEEAKIAALREQLDVRKTLHHFGQRLNHEHASVVQQVLIELANYLRQTQETLQMAANSDQPDSLLQSLLRSILDACVRYNGGNNEVSRLSAVCLGLIGCVDANRIHANREVREIVVVSNFNEPGDTTDFVLFILEEILVKAFMSTIQPKNQGFLGYAIQELLEKCDFQAVVSIHRRVPDNPETLHLYEKWLTIPESVRITLDPFLKSKYIVSEMKSSPAEYPIFKDAKKYTNWLRGFVLDLLEHPNNDNAKLVFAPLRRVIRIEDTSVAEFLLPYVVLHAVVSGTDEQRYAIQFEMMTVLEHDLSSISTLAATHTKACSEAIFRVLDYMTKWTQLKQTALNRSRRYEFDSHKNTEIAAEIDRVTNLVGSIPAELISSRAVECNSYARALFHWEQHIRDVKKETGIAMNADPLMLQRLQDIYAQIDEPDGIEGISAHLSLDMDQQVVSHRRNGRWAAAQSWYEIQLAEEPSNVDAQVNLLQCLKESGQHDVLLNYVEGISRDGKSINKLLPFATEAAWTTGRWKMLQKYADMAPNDVGGDFNINLARVLLQIPSDSSSKLTGSISALRDQLGRSLTAASTTSLSACHENMFRFHVLTELEMLTENRSNKQDKHQILEAFERRLEVLGSYRADKQYLLSVRRAAMELLPNTFTKLNIASAWLTSARLARKGNSMHQSFNAVLHASRLGDASATIEHARLLWKGGNSRKAIQSLEQAIAKNAFISHDESAHDSNRATTENSVENQNMLAARAHLLLAKWQDSAGQTHSAALRSQYQQAAKLHMTWEKGHYYLGRHYNKLIEAEKSLPVDQQSQQYLSGEMAKLVVENYLRSLNYGVKYLYQTLPRILTLWLDLGSQVMSSPDAKAGNREWQHNMLELRKEQLKALHTKLIKYMTRTPSFIFYTALPQIMARIAHPNQEVYKYLRQLILKVMQSYPQQSLWALFAVCASTQADRKARGSDMLIALRNSKKSETTYDLRSIIKTGEILASDLLMACTAGNFEGNRTVDASLSKDLGFNQKRNTPSQLVVPMESTLTATLPTLTDKLSKHKAFSQDVVTISSFLDHVLVLSSLQKPRKLMCRGSNGRVYGLMCKPKDDLRKDQRLMEFNSMINRMLKRDAESSRRQLYIKTYAVVPLNEDCGLIEWVNGLKTLRDILLGFLKQIGIQPNYTEIKVLLDEALSNPNKLHEWYDKLLKQYPAVFYLWFIQQFPDPSVWFAARIRYTRSCAVMSMVGTILGLGDRHGENILFEEGTGGTFHVDFNCLFDKGQTFAQPERVPFRLTHNMVDAMGPYGYEGPFRKSSELTIALLRANEETLMTIMEAFVHDPTLDLMKKNGKGRSRRVTAMADEHAGPPDSPQGVLDAIRRKTRGLLAGESVPLGVEGQVDELIKMAVSPVNLANMYIGWCAFL